MKILAVVDLHGEEKNYKNMARMVEKHKPDLIISAGDHTWFGADEKKMIEAHDLGVPVLILPGNHEVVEGTKKAVKGLKNVIFIHQGIYEKDGVMFLGCGEGGFGVGNSDFERVKSFFAKEMKAHKGKNILITHEPPFDTLADQLTSGKHVGSESLREFIKETQPMINICGHIHEAANTISKIGNTVIIHPGPKGKIIEL